MCVCVCVYVGVRVFSKQTYVGVSAIDHTRVWQREREREREREKERKRVIS